MPTRTVRLGVCAGGGTASRVAVPGVGGGPCSADKALRERGPRLSDAGAAIRVLPPRLGGVAGGRVVRAELVRGRPRRVAGWMKYVRPHLRLYGPAVE